MHLVKKPSHTAKNQRSERRYGWAKRIRGVGGCVYVCVCVHVRAKGGECGPSAAERGVSPKKPSTTHERRSRPIYFSFGCKVYHTRCTERESEREQKRLVFFFPMVF